MKSQLTAAILLLWSVSAQAIPVAPFDAFERPLPRISKKDLANYDFSGVVALSNCSGALVRFSGQPETSQAYVLTNGHCLQRFRFLPPGQTVYQEPKQRQVRLYATPNQTVETTTKTLVYGTMTDTDAALYRLNETYAQLKRKGVKAFTLGVQHPLPGLEINVVSGYWREGYSCSIDKFVYVLKESNWLFQDSIRYSETGCQIKGGTSGSPVLKADQRTIIGVNNTKNESGRRCKMNNPCEIDKDGNKNVLEGRGYAQQTYLFYSCLTEDFEIDLSRSGCTLPKP